MKKYTLGKELKAITKQLRLQHQDVSGSIIIYGLARLIVFMLALIAIFNTVYKPDLIGLTALVIGCGILVIFWAQDDVIASLKKSNKEAGEHEGKKV